MKTQTKVDTTLFTMIVATLIAGLCLSSISSLMSGQNMRPDTFVSKTVTNKQL